MLHDPEFLILPRAATLPMLQAGEQAIHSRRVQRAEKAWADMVAAAPRLADVDPALPLEAAALAALAEAKWAAERWPAYNSAHEGFAVIHEEFDELKTHVWTNQKRRDLAAMRAEALQLAATALRFAADCCTEERGRR